MTFKKETVSVILLSSSLGSNVPLLFPNESLKEPGAAAVTVYARRLLRVFLPTAAVFDFLFFVLFCN